MAVWFVRSFVEKEVVGTSARWRWDSDVGGLCVVSKLAGCVRVGEGFSGGVGGLTWSQGLWVCGVVLEEGYDVI